LLKSKHEASGLLEMSAPLERTEFDYDIAIVGGGIVGATLAAALKGSGLTTALIETQARSSAVAKGQAYAIHLSSSRIFEGIGVWGAIAPQVEYFQQVRLSDADSPHVVNFQPSDLQTSVLGYVATHRVLLQELLTFLETCDHVDWFCPAQVIAMRVDTGGVDVQLAAVPDEAGTQSDRSLPSWLRVRMVVAADGSRSQLRQWAGIRTHGWSYWQSCLVATIAPEKFHDHVAYERFWPSGPFAILPTSRQECRIVWTAPHAEAQALLALADQEFIQALTERYGTQMGKLSLVGQRYVFPARWMQASRYIGPRLALVGDAAHTCHPVGGQGLNLGIRDAAALAQILSGAHQVGEDIGHGWVLRRYQRWRWRQNLWALGFTDLLNRLFSNQWLIVVQVRRLGLRVMQNVAPLRRLMLRFMAGLMGRSPQYLARSSEEISRETVINSGP
jgi:2-octaprenyl-6-methoxyphenol hydroxylase